MSEWAIQDEATGEWWSATDGWGLTATLGPYWVVAATAAPVFTKQNNEWHKDYRASARIVSAPPREMTEAECMTWLLNETGLFMKGYVEKCFAGWGVYNLDTRECVGSSDVSHFDAIRAARRALEKKP